MSWFYFVGVFELLGVWFGFVCLVIVCLLVWFWVGGGCAWVGGWCLGGCLGWGGLVVCFAWGWGLFVLFGWVCLFCLGGFFVWWLGVELFWVFGDSGLV